MISRTLEQDRDVERRRRERAAAKDVPIPAPEDLARRQRLEADDEAWLLYYFGKGSGVTDPFWYDFTDQQKQMIDAIRNAILHGGDQSLAASRGEGKTTLCERLTLKYVLQGAVTFAVLFGATGEAAASSLDAMKEAIEENDRLAADYPEVCVPVRALENTPNRAHYQTVSGNRHDNGEPYERSPSKFTWCGREIVFPNVPGSSSARAIIATRGLDAAVRGLKKKGRRPQLAIIDDPDTEETARSEDQAAKLEARIDKAIAGLGGQKRRISRVMLTTLQSRISVSYRYTDPEKKPSWKGRRFRFLVSPPERQDLWDEYIQLRRADWENERTGEPTTHARDFYATNREAMEAGAVVANPHRFGNDQLSPLQFYYDEIARTSPESVATEYDNDPPEESGPVESGITPHRVQTQLSGYERKMIPPGCTVLTQGIDVRKVALHWVIRAWRPDGTGFTIDYGVHEVLGTTYGSEEGLDVAIRRAILARIEETREAEYMNPEGELLPVNMTLVDAGWQTDAVYSAVAAAGLGVRAVMGAGRSSGCAQPNFSDLQRRTIDRRPLADGSFETRKFNGRLWLIMADVDRWKQWEHARWLTSPEKPGCMFLYGQPGTPGARLNADEQSHHSYARHICNEVEVEEPYQGTIRRRWKAKSDNTHYLDASVYADVAANILGVRLESSASAAIDARRKAAPKTLEQMRSEARR